MGALETANSGGEDGEGEGKGEVAKYVGYRNQDFWNPK